MTGLRWVLGGLIGGAVGILVWVLIGYYANYEIGWIAWGIGFVVGVGVRYAAYLDGEDESEAQGFGAAGIAIGSILLAKYLVFALVIGGDSAEVEQAREFINNIRYDDQALKVVLADEIAEQMQIDGQTIEWPPSMNYEDATKQADYPEELWQQAEAKWSRLSAAKKQEMKRERMLLKAQLAELMVRPSFGDMFSPWDGLWFCLAAFTAYKIGVGTYGNE